MAHSQGVQSHPLPHTSQVQGPAGSEQVQSPAFGVVELLSACMGYLRLRVDPK